MKSLDFLGEHLGGEDLQLVAFDMRGRGRSEVTPRGTYGWENHALDVFGLADALGVERFSLLGQSMGASVAMKAAELDGSRIETVILVDLAGRVDPGIGPVVATALGHIEELHADAESFLTAIKADGLVEPWSEYWDRWYLYQLRETEGGVRCRIDLQALAEDRSYGAGQAPYTYERWKHLTMPSLLLRAAREFRPGSGHVIPPADREHFLREVRRGVVVDVDANHLTINTHLDSVSAIRDFLQTSL